MVTKFEINIRSFSYHMFTDSKAGSRKWYYSGLSKILAVCLENGKQPYFKMFSAFKGVEFSTDSLYMASPKCYTDRIVLTPTGFRSSVYRR